MCVLSLQNVGIIQCLFSCAYLLAFVYSSLCMYSFNTELCNVQFSHSWDNKGYSIVFYSITKQYFTFYFKPTKCNYFQLETSLLSLL